MKSKYTFWKCCLISLAGLAGLTGCKELSCNFSYSPTTPCAGESVTFVNESVGADDYLWDFGDNGTSTSSSPTHIFRKPGTYTVRLRIMRNKVEKKYCTHDIVVIDTIPSIAMDSDSIYTYTPVTIKANVYNPWKRKLTYQWTLPKEAVVLDGKSLDSSVVVCYFTKSMPAASVRLNLHVGDKLFELSRQDTIHHHASQSLLYRIDQTCYEQFIYTIRSQTLYQDAQTTTSAENITLLQQENDSTYLYKDWITLKQVNQMIKEDTIYGFQVDRLMAKIYAYGQQGLWVRNLLDTNQRLLVASSHIHAVKADVTNNRLYWASNEGIFVHSLLQLRSNQDDFTPRNITMRADIARISMNTTLH